MIAHSNTPRKTKNAAMHMIHIFCKILMTQYHGKLDGGTPKKQKKGGLIYLFSICSEKKNYQKTNCGLPSNN